MEVRNHPGGFGAGLVITWQNLRARCPQNTGPRFRGVIPLHNHRTGTKSRICYLVQCPGSTTWWGSGYADWSRLHHLLPGPGSIVLLPGPGSTVCCLVPGLLDGPGSNAWSGVCWRRLPSFTESDWCFASDGWRIFLTFFGLCSESTCSDAHRAE